MQFTTFWTINEAMTSQYGRLLPFVFGLILLFCIADILTTYSNLTTVRSDERLVSHTYGVQQELAATRIALDEAETGERGYLITGNEKYLEPYSHYINRIKMHISTLKQLTGDNPIQQRRITTLSSYATEQISNLQKGIELEKQEGSASSQTFDLVAQGRETMTKIRSVIGVMDNDEQALLTKRMRELDSSFNSVYLSSTVASMLILLFVFLAFYLIRREMQKRNELEENKDAFISMASHELKTPITSLKVYIGIALKKLHPNSVPEVQKYLIKIDDQTNRLSTLIRDMLDISRIQTGKMKIDKDLFDLNALIVETVEALSETTNRHKFTITGKLPKPVYGDRYRVYQVLVNLLTNAIKYSPDGGKIIVTAKKIPHAVQVSVADSGIGIDPRFRKKIFTRLFQISDTKVKTFPGLGMGLYIAAEIIKRHGGRIWVESEIGKGSTFFFTLQEE